MQFDVWTNAGKSKMNQFVPKIKLAKNNEII